MKSYGRFDALKIASHAYRMNSASIGSCSRFARQARHYTLARERLLTGLHSTQLRLIATLPPTHEQFSRITAIPPTDLKPPRIKSHKEWRRWQRRLMLIGTVSGLTFAYDYYFNESSLYRNLKCVVVLSIVAVDYKLNFNEGKDINALHTRVANRVYDLIASNGGLYIKMGQALAMQAAVLPPVFQQKFAQLFDMAPQDPWSEVEKLFLKDFGKRPDEVFRYIDHRAVASASVAQVHKAQLKTGEWVAVKIQHPKIEKQVNWDLGAYRMVMYIYDRFIFDIPVYFTVDYTCNRLLTEIDFQNEARNAENMNAVLQTEPSLRNRVYIPRIYHSLTSRHVLTTEWIDGVSLSNKEALNRAGFSKSQIMDIMINLFAAQIFKWGVVHCDPHLGNQIFRWYDGRLQLVLIDHGLYIYETPEFRQQYCELWKNMFIFNDKAIRDIAKSWGIGSPELFASATLLRPYKAGGIRPDRAPETGVTKTDNESQQSRAREDFEMQMRMKDQLKQFIQDTNKMPLELIFLGRNMRIVQGCNQLMGSPVNRIKILANWASRSLAMLPNLTFRERVRAWTNHLVFKFVVGLSDIGFWITKIRRMVLRRENEGFEDLLERQMKGIAKKNFGIQIQDEAFAA
ncbi:ABC1 family-domain-containing protein [Lipomyces kononenkoae]|uniref:ABC1 family-domain-containing protein n=1 Tax=Lipomyces kononenkoae TaxID=34357 RepID=A0ACC3SXM1_LIPKO